MARRLYDLGMPLVGYTEPVNTRVFRKAQKLNEEKSKEFRRLREKYAAIAFVSLPFFFRGCVKLQFPLELEVPSDTLSSPQVVEIQSLSEMFDILTHHYERGIKAFDELFGEEIR